MPSKSSTTLRKNLVDVAMGRKPADLVVRNGQWVSVQSGEIIPETDIAVKDGHIAFVGPDAKHTIGKGTKVIDAGGRYLVPGLLDAHMHVESGMVTVTEFVRAVAPHGTTGMFVDPHEMANIFGLKGVKLMVDEAAKQPIHVWVQMPSCVPSSPGLETPGASIGPKEVAEAMTWPGIIGLGEMMNFPGVLRGDAKMLADGSAWYDVAAQVKAITEMKLDSRRFILCTDDSHAETLSRDGHMDRVLRHAIAQGLDPLTAIQMMTINTAEHFGLTREMGMIAPGRWADIVLVEDLRNFRADLVIAKGEVIAENGKWKVSLPTFTYPEWATDSVHLKRRLRPEDFRLSYSDKHNGHVKANVIGVIENQAPTRHLKMPVVVNKGEVVADMRRDVAKVAVVQRHKGMSGVTVGLVSGFGFTERCAVASTVAHDSHHMIVVGTDDADMAVAANKLARVGGGQVVVKKGRGIGLVELGIAGLMSKERADVVARKAATVLEGFRFCGCKLNNPNMQLSLLALVVIPELRISDKGLVDVTKFGFLPVLEKV